MLKKFINTLLAVTISAGIICPSFTVKASPRSSIENNTSNSLEGSFDTSVTLNKDEGRQAVYNKMLYINKLMNNSYEGQVGLLFDLRVLAMDIIWVQFINSGKYVSFSADEKKSFNSRLKDFVDRFNNQYKEGVDSSGKNFPVTHIGDIGDTLTDTTANTILNGTIYDYLKNLYDDINNKVAGKLGDVISKTEENDKILKEYDSQLKYAYYILQSSGQSLRDCKGLVPDWGLYVSNEDKYKGNINKLTSLLTEQKYRVFVDYGRRAIAKASAQSVDFKVGDGQTLFDKLTSTYSINGGSNKVYVNKAFLAMFACTSIYRPFRSKVGDQDYTDALRYLTKKDDIVDLFNQAKNYKKPLYKRELSKSNGEVTGNASKITLKEFMDSIENDGSGGLVTIRGKFMKPQDSDSYQFIISEQNTLKEVYKGKNAGSNSDKETGNTAQEPDKETVENKKTSNDLTSDNGDKGSNTSEDKDNVSENKDNHSAEEVKKEDDSSQEGRKSSSGVGRKMGSKQEDNAKNSKDKINKDEEDFAENDKGVYGPDYLDGVATITSSEYTITDKNVMTQPLITWDTHGWGVDDVKGKSCLTLLILRNIFKDFPGAKCIPNADKRFLFTDAFGDIVLDDGTVIFPACCNPAFMQANQKYYPYTAGFMNAYPKVVDPTSISEQFVLASSSDVGKFMIVDDDVYISNDNLKKLEESNSGDKKKESSKSVIQSELITPSHLKGQEVQGDKKGGYSLAVTSDKTILPFNLQMYQDGGGGCLLMTLRNLAYKGGWWNKITKSGWAVSQDAILILDPSKTVSNGSNTPLFPYNGATDGDVDNQNNANFIAKEMFQNMTRNDSGEFSMCNGTYKNDFMTFWLRDGLQGNRNIESYVKNSIKDEQAINSGFFDKFIKIICDFCKSMLKMFGYIEGMLGVKTVYEDSIFGKALYFCNKYIIVFMAFAVFLVLLRFMRRYISFLSLIFYAGLSTVGVYLMLNTLPQYLPEIYNFPIEGIVRNLSYKSLLMRQEQYISPFSTDEIKKSKGTHTMTETTSVTLYKLQDYQIDNICSSFGIPKAKLLSGTKYIHDKQSGLYFEGNVIKANANSLLNTVSIFGRNEKSQDFGLSTYRLYCKKRVSSTIDFYMPYNQMLDGLVGKLNKMMEVYRIPIKTLDYSDSLHKDSFSVDSYINSALFLKPKNLGNYWKGETDSERDKLHEVFGKNNVDWLGMSDFLLKDLSKYQETLWYRTMHKRNLIDANKLRQIIVNINADTADFIISIKNCIPYTSDENLIKIIALYATLEFNNEISGLGNFVYPTNLNYEELSISDVYLPVLVDDYRLYTTTNHLSLVDYIRDSHGLPGILLFIPVMIISFFICLFFRFFTPVFYILLVFLIVLRIIMKEHLGDLIKGFFKATGIIITCYTLFVLATVTAYHFNKTFAVYVLLLVEYLVLFMIISTVILSIITSPMDFGSTKVNAMLNNIKDKVMGANPLKFLNINTTNILKDKKNKVNNYIKDSRDFKETVSRYKASNSDINAIYNKGLHVKPKNPFNVNAQNKSYNGTVIRGSVKRRKPSNTNNDRVYANNYRVKDLDVDDTL